jgi:hypothetical protein
MAIQNPKSKMVLVVVQYLPKSDDGDEYAVSGRPSERADGARRAQPTAEHPS